jgi:hypothetical protein
MLSSHQEGIHRCFQCKTTGLNSQGATRPAVEIPRIVERASFFAALVE